jgi:hypothetical protein
LNPRLAETTEIAVSKIIGENEDDVGWPLFRCLHRGRKAKRDKHQAQCGSRS